MKHVQEQKIKDLERDIKFYSKSIKKNPADSDSHYMIANAHIKLGEVTNNIEANYEQAMQHYNAALNLIPDNPLYLVDMAKLHVKMNQPEAAARDVDAVKSLPIPKDVEGLYINNALNNFISIEDIADPLPHLTGQESNIDNNDI